MSALSLTIAGFKLTVLGRQFPVAQDFWDGNWLNVHCECKTLDAHVEAQGPFVHLSEVALLADTFEALLQRATIEANVDFMEPELGMNFKTRSCGNVQFEVRLKPKVPGQSQCFTFEIDLTHLQSALEQCKAILDAYPIRESSAQKSSRIRVTQEPEHK